MEELKSLFGEGEALTFEQFNEKLSKAEQIKLANLKTGNYVDINKYKELEQATKGYKTQIDEFKTKYSNYEEMQKELTTYKEKEKLSGLLEKVAKVGVAKEFEKFVLTEVNNELANIKDDKDKDFDKQLAEYLKTHEHFLEKKKGVFTKGSSVPLNGGSAEAKSSNEKINNILRNTKNKGE